MLCDQCAREVHSVLCGNCDANILVLGAYCYECGHPLGKDSPEEENQENDFSKRILCSDGTCIGVIDGHGFCKVCGKPYIPDS